MERRNAQERRSYGENTFANHNQATKAPTAWNAAGVFLFCKIRPLLTFAFASSALKKTYPPPITGIIGTLKPCTGQSKQNSLG
ncbi:hypothetical protein DJ031_06470 [bacterium endosymbiont of Escarpia laminata]|nr:MAG: hypothetical protein DJ031_06470 [bacterium endosymbiont of Escarpia laminata]